MSQHGEDDAMPSITPASELADVAEQHERLPVNVAVSVVVATYDRPDDLHA